MGWPEVSGRPATDLSELFSSADRNATEALRHFGRHAAVAELIEDTSMLLVAAASAMPGAFHNAAIRLDASTPPPVVLAKAGAFAATRRRDLLLWASEHRDADVAAAARAAGHRLYAAATGMAITAPPAAAPPAPQIDLLEVSDDRGVAAFASVHRCIFAEGGRPADGIAHFASNAALLAPTVRAFVATVHGEPASCAMVLHTGREAGIYWVGTRPNRRRRGLGELVTRAAVRAGFALGAAVVVLHATPMGVPVYRSIGFEPIGAYSRYLIAAREHELARVDSR